MTFPLSIDLGVLPQASNPFPELSSLDNRVFAVAFSNVGKEPKCLTWDANGNVTVVEVPPPDGPKLRATGGQGSATIAVTDPNAQVKIGMRVSQGMNNGGDAWPAGTIVVAAEPRNADNIRRITLSGNALVALNGEVQFSGVVPDQEITGPVTLQFPTDQTLSSCRIVFAIGGHPWPVINPDGTVAGLTVGSDPYFQALTWDYVEFTLDVDTKGPTKFTLNQSMEDQFGFPIQIEVSPGISGQPSKAGVKISLDAAINRFNQFVGGAPLDAQRAFGDLASLPGAKRILSPDSRITLTNPVPPPALASYFDGQIVSFFNHYETATLKMINVPGPKGLHVLEGKVIQDSSNSNQRILRLIDNADQEEYDVYEPFWGRNGYKSRPGEDSVAVPADPPSWIKTNESPGEMVVAGDGVFADNTVRPNFTGDTKLLGAIENLIVTAFNRGVALNPYSDWLFGSQFLTLSAGGAVTFKKDENTLSFGGAVPVVVGMAVAGTGVGQGATVTDISPAPQDSTRTLITLSAPNSADSSVADVAFSWAGQPNPFFRSAHNSSAVWNYYVQFFHQDDVVLDGLAYAYSFDDQGGFSSTIVSGDGIADTSNRPGSGTITLGLPSSSASGNSRGIEPGGRPHSR